MHIKSQRSIYNEPYRASHYEALLPNAEKIIIAEEKKLLLRRIVFLHKIERRFTTH